MSATLTPAIATLSDLTRRCRQQQQAWSRLPVRERLRPIDALRRLLVAEQRTLCEAVERDMGKPADETLGGDILPLAEAYRYLQREAARVLRPRRVSRRLRPLFLVGQKDTVYRRPRGVVGVIGTWNYPLYLNGVQIVQALAAGNGVLWKPSEVAPASADALFELMTRAGFPDGLVQKLPATREGGKELAEADVDHVVFTGSSAVGHVLAPALGRRLVTSALELSGVDALFVLGDADPEFAARAAWFGCTINRGQTCLAVRRTFVQRDVYAAFLGALRPLAAAAGPVRLALPAQAEQAIRLVREAIAGGGRLLDAGRIANPSCESDGLPIRPTVVVDARPDMALCREASFAPVMAVLPFDTLDDALRMDAQCPYALGASVFTADPAAAEAWAGRLRTGTVSINDVVVPTAHPATPFGGSGESGWGVTQGEEGLREMTVPQVVSVRGGRYRPHYDMTGGAGQGDLVRALLDYGHGATLGQRLGGLVRLVRAMWRGK